MEEKFKTFENRIELLKKTEVKKGQQISLLEQKLNSIKHSFDTKLKQAIMNLNVISVICLQSQKWTKDTQCKKNIKISYKSVKIFFINNVVCVM